MRTGIVLGVLVLLATQGHAASRDVRLAPPLGAGGATAFQPGDTADHVRIKTVNRDSKDENRVIVTVEIDPGFHINANPASLDYLIPTTLNITNQAPRRVIYPPPILFKPKFADEALEVYEGTVQIAAEFPQGLLRQVSSLFGTVTAQACTEAICLPPAALSLAWHGSLPDRPSSK